VKIAVGDVREMLQARHREQIVPVRRFDVRITRPDVVYVDAAGNVYEVIITFITKARSVTKTTKGFCTKFSS